MANKDHVAILKSGVDAWNAWRAEKPRVRPDLSGADFHGADFLRADLRAVNLRGAHFDDSVICRCDFSDADATGVRFVGGNLVACVFDRAILARANFRSAIVEGSKFRGADLRRATLKHASFKRCNMTGSVLDDAALVEASIIKCHLSKASMARVDLSNAVFNDVGLAGADISHARVYGISAWRPIIDEHTRQKDLIVSPADEPMVSIDDLALAQLVDLIVRSSSVRSVLHEFGRRAVLILGRFNDAGLENISAIKTALRALGLAPIVFDFPRLPNRTLGETVRVLAHLSRFIVADMTDPRCVPQELMTVVPNLPSVPVLGVLQGDGGLWSMAESIEAYPWFTGVVRFTTPGELVNALPQAIADGPERWLQRVDAGRV
jgi:hypothetical protein